MELSLKEGGAVSPPLGTGRGSPTPKEGSEGSDCTTVHVLLFSDVNEAPTDIELYTNNMNENLAAGSFISNLTMIDEDENTMTVCTLLQDGGGRIALNGTTLVAGETNTNYEEELSHVIEISLRCCDQLEACITKKFNISVKGKG